MVVDPFAGGGSIPLEALRLGCETFASDLNPVACLILKVMLAGHPPARPRAGGRAPQGRRRNQGQGREGAGRPSTPRTRTAQRPSPTCGRGRCVARHPTAARRFPSCAPCGCAGSLTASGRCVPRWCGMMAFPLVWNSRYSSRSPIVAGSTVARARATCVCCGAVLPPDLGTFPACRPTRRRRRGVQR